MPRVAERHFSVTERLRAVSERKCDDIGTVERD